MENTAARGLEQRVFAVLYRLTKEINAPTAFPAFLRSACRAAAELVGGEACMVSLVDEAREELRCRASWGLPAEEEARWVFKVGEGIAGWVAEHGAPALIADLEADPRLGSAPGPGGQARSLVAVPLVMPEGVIGVLSASSPRAGAFGAEHEELLSVLGEALVKDVENARLHRLSVIDPLTKAFNRQYLSQRLPEEVERFRRYGDPLSMALLDIDRFKPFNATFGGPAGDFVLKEVARLAQTQIRDTDALVRYGGGALLVLLSNTPLTGARIISERLRTMVESARFAWSDRKLGVTVSVGLAALGEGPTSDEELIRWADQALARAKELGRNRVEPSGT